MAETSSPAATVPLFAVVAVGRNGAIGRNGALPWTLPSDLAHFRTMTGNCPMLMGRRTFESIGRVLPGRDTVIVSRGWDAGQCPEGAFLGQTAAAGVALARQRAIETGAAGVAVIGGAELLAAVEAELARIELTIVDLHPEADTFWPMPDPYVWRETHRARPLRQAGDEADCVFLTFERAAPAPSPSIEAATALR